ncbi:MAG: hypothetical protein K0S33_2952 [Bacteroidetes bacterium]|jgi:hypothetical protein|nr:hypothetical protein [Bacteroidota bacterium]
MRKIFVFGVLSFVLLVSNSCKNDLDSLAPYVESVAVYGLIDPNDSVNYIRVNRVFLGQGNANEIAQIQDSVYFKPNEASVIVEKYWNNIKKQTYVFSETYEVPLQPGTFNTNQLIYKSTQKFKSDSSGKYFEYKLIVKVSETGKEFTATTKLIEGVTPANSGSALCNAGIQNCFFTQGSYGITTVSNASSNMKFLSPVNAAICGFKMRLYYTTEYLNGTRENKYFDFVQGNQVTSSTGGDEVMDFSFKGLQWYTAVGSGIQNEPNFKEHQADSMGFIFNFGGNEYNLYRTINNISGSFGQEKPIYTNISNGGVGVFSSRTKITVIKKMFNYTGGGSQVNVITQPTVQNLMNSTMTCHLHFRGPNWPVGPGC